jgi:Skp family chaperone for outer membrane proteins
MRTTVTLLIIVCSLMSLSAQNAKKPLAYYIADSILPYMPLHKSNQNSLDSLRGEHNTRQVEMQSQRQQKADEIKYDSIHQSASPLIMRLLHEQLRQIDDNIRMYDQSSTRDIQSKDSTFHSEEIAEIQKSADHFARTEGYKNIYEFNDAERIGAGAPDSFEMVDLTKDIIKEMKL